MIILCIYPKMSYREKILCEFRILHSTSIFKIQSSARKKHTFLELLFVLYILRVNATCAIA